MAAIGKKLMKSHIKYACDHHRAIDDLLGGQSERKTGIPVYSAPFTDGVLEREELSHFKCNGASL